MGVDIHEMRRVNGQEDTNPAAKRFSNPAAAYRHYSVDYQGSRSKTWKYYKAQAIAKKRMRRSWYHD